MELRFHKHAEYQHLNKLQKQELREWRLKNSKGSKGAASAAVSSSNKLNSLISSAVSKHFKKLETDVTDEEKIKKYILDVVQGNIAIPKKSANAQTIVNAAASAASVPPQLKSILKEKGQKKAQSQQSKHYVPTGQSQTCGK